MSTSVDSPDASRKVTASPVYSYGIGSLVAKSYRAQAVESLINGFLLDLRRNWKQSQLNWPGGLAYYWNEREFQWALLQRMKTYAGPQGLGSDRWVRAEGSMPPPRWSKGAGTLRSDIVVIDHSEYRRYLSDLGEGREDDNFPEYESMIELKVVWTSTGPAFYREAFEGDVTKLHKALRDSISRSAYFVILDNLDRNRVPYFTPDELSKLKRGTKVGIFHWPDGTEPVTVPETARIGRY